MNSSVSGPVPRCARGHSATYDPGSKTLFVYGGLREGQRYSELYVLNTLTWKWKLITVGLFRVINVFAVFFSYRVEVFNMCFVFASKCRQKEMFQMWRITPLPFIRKSFLSLVEFSQVTLRWINPAVMLCTSSAQSLNSGTSRLWKGTNRCLGLGQSSSPNNLPSSKCGFVFVFPFLNIAAILLFA